MSLERIIVRRIKHRIDSAQAWHDVNPILEKGEFGIEEESRAFKIGDGVTLWNDLELGGLRGPPGPAGFISSDDNNRLKHGTDGGLFVSELDVNLVTIYEENKNL